jgi:hypothetical protein
VLSRSNAWKLNAKLLGFNRDPDFGDVIDGLMLVDLTKVDRDLLGRYLGKVNAESFLSSSRAPRLLCDQTR